MLFQYFFAHKVQQNKKKEAERQQPAATLSTAATINNHPDHSQENHQGTESTPLSMTMKKNV